MDSTLVCYNNGIDTEETLPNKHLEHPEDMIMYGRRAALRTVNALLLHKHLPLGVKWDGAPAIVFGTNPENGKFFVGTKSVFNKVKVKIAYSYEDIDAYYKGEVANILRLCFRHLPRIGGIVQGDYIGVSGGRTYTPNALEYRFATETPGHIVFAPHTGYDVVSPTATPRFGVNVCGESDCFMLGVNEATAFIDGKVKFNWFKFMKNLVRAKVPKDKKTRDAIFKHINTWIRLEMAPPSAELYSALPDKYKQEVNLYTFKVWDQIFQLKQSLMSNIRVSGTVTPYLDGKPTAHEGFVTQNEVPVKLVDRMTFSKANFNLSKNWTNEKV